MSVLSGDIVCPFCGEDDFDKIGLKFHLRSCSEYEATEDIDSIRDKIYRAGISHSGSL